MMFLQLYVAIKRHLTLYTVRIYKLGKDYKDYCLKTIDLPKTSMLYCL